MTQAREARPELIIFWCLLGGFIGVIVGFLVAATVARSLTASTDSDDLLGLVRFVDNLIAMHYGMIGSTIGGVLGCVIGTYIGILRAQPISGDVTTIANLYAQREPAGTSRPSTLPTSQETAESYDDAIAREVAEGLGLGEQPLPDPNPVASEIARLKARLAELEGNKPANTGDRDPPPPEPAS